MFHKTKSFNSQQLNFEFSCTVLYINTQIQQKHFNVVNKFCIERKVIYDTIVLLFLNC